MRRSKVKFAILWKLLVFEHGTNNYRIAARIGMKHYTVSKIANAHRGSTEAHVLRLGAGLVCTEGELSQMGQLREANGNQGAGIALRGLFEAGDLGIETIELETGIGTATVQAFIDGEIAPDEDELLRIMIALMVRDGRRNTFNRLLEAAGYYRLGFDPGSKAA